MTHAVKMALLDLEQGRFKDNSDAALLYLLEKWSPEDLSEEQQKELDMAKAQLENALVELRAVEKKLAKCEESLATILPDFAFGGDAGEIIKNTK